MITNRSKASGAPRTPTSKHRFVLDLSLMTNWAKERDPNGRGPRLASVFTKRRAPQAGRFPSHKEPGGPTEGEITCAAKHASKRIQVAARAQRVPVKVLWTLARISLGGARRQHVRFALEEYLALQVTELVQSLSAEERERLERVGLNRLADDAVQALLQHAVQMVSDGRQLHVRLPENRVVMYAAAPGSAQRNCFLVCRDEPGGRRILSAETPGKWRRHQRSRLRWDRAYYREPLGRRR